MGVIWAPPDPAAGHIRTVIGGPGLSKNTQIVELGHEKASTVLGYCEFFKHNYLLPTLTHRAIQTNVK